MENIDSPTAAILLFIASSAAFVLSKRRTRRQPSLTSSINIYKTLILPIFIDKVCASTPVLEQRLKIVPLAKGEVLELGIGSGLNLPHYNSGTVTKVVGVDPDDYLWKRSAKRRLMCRIPVERIGLSGENIPLPDQIFDSAVVTYSLCTIPDAVKALKEVKRLLKPEGKLYFLEHGKAPEKNIVKWQRRIEPYSKIACGGCSPGKDIPSLLEEAGFKIDDMKSAYVPMGPKLWSYNYWGEASVEK